MPSSYTEKEVERMVDIYTANPSLETVERLMTLLNKPKKSIISKLVKLGVYEKRGYRTKTGETPITKLEIVRTLEDTLDIQLPGLDKAPKGTLKLLVTTVLKQTQLFDEALDNIQELSESHEVMSEMLANRKKSSDFYDPIATLHEDE